MKKGAEGPRGRGAEAAPPRRLGATRRAGLVVAVLALAGCATQQRVGAGDGVPEDPPPALDSVVVSWNERVALLGRLQARGVLELRWRDEDGTEHFEPQVNAQLWLDGPDRTALAARKLGEYLFWLGSDETGLWFFDLLEAPTRLLLADPEARLEAGLGDGVVIGIGPRALRDLMALTPLPPADALASSRDEAGRWWFAAPGAAGPLRIRLEGDRPAEVVLLDDAGVPRLRSRLSRWASAEITGRSRAALPLVATILDLETLDGRASVKLAIGEAGDAQGDPRWERVFDLDRLRAALRPDRVERLAADPES